MQERGDFPRGSASDLALCLQSLTHDGRVAVSPSLSAIDDNDAIPLLKQMDAHLRDELGLALPMFSVTAALWGARLFHQLCRFVVCRDIGEKPIKDACSVSCPTPREAQTDWSVDLTLRHLPTLFQLARHLSNADPLVEQMKRIATEWPLSSVGIPGLANFPVETFIDHPALRRLYADRIISAADTSRLGHPQVDDLLRADLGVHRELAPHIAGKLFATSHETN